MKNIYDLGAEEFHAIIPVHQCKNCSGVMVPSTAITLDCLEVIVFSDSAKKPTCRCPHCNNFCFWDEFKSI